jgi:hypothetical protein
LLASFCLLGINIVWTGSRPTADPAEVGHL